VERWRLDRLKPYARNARKHPPQQIEQLREAMRTYGWTVPILVREDGTIIAGHARYEAGRAEGYTEAPVIIARGWSEQQCRAYTIADNRIALNSAWDEDVLKLELGELSALGIDLEPLGFGLNELGQLLGPQQGLTDPDAVPEAPANPVSRPGDLWILGQHRLLCGDSTVAPDVELVLGGVKPHLMVTDPPYGVDYDPAWRTDAGLKQNKQRLGKVANDDRADWRGAWALFPGSVAYVWHAGRYASTVQDSLAAAGFEVRSQIIWAKDRFALSRGHYHWQHEPCWYAVRQGPANWSGDRKQSTLWSISSGNQDAETSHGTQKPVECMKRPMENNSSPGQAVYEPFCGSGTSIVAAEMTGRACLAIEIDPAYVDVAVKRWQAFSGQQSVLESDSRVFDAIAAERLPDAA
jgi:DNA modification methylase